MIAAWYSNRSASMLIVYVVLDGRNFGAAGMLHWLVANARRASPIRSSPRSVRSLDLARSVAGRFRRYSAGRIPETFGIRRLPATTWRSFSFCGV